VTGRSKAFTPLKWTSFFHSCVYSSLLICAFALGKPQPETLVLGWTHGLLWIGMSCACIAAARMRIVPLRLAVAVAVLGGIGPFFGSWEFVRAQRARDTRMARETQGTRDTQAGRETGTARDTQETRNTQRPRDTATAPTKGANRLRTKSPTVKQCEDRTCGQPERGA
jgi:hypothetical protein